MPPKPSKFLRFFTIRQRLFLQSIFVALLGILVLGLGSNEFLRHEEELHVDEIKGNALELWIREYAAAMFYHESLASFIIDELRAQEKILTQFAALSEAEDEQKDRERTKLQQASEAFYARLKERGIKQLHFHAPDAESLLRMHKPEKFGDSLKDIRPTVVKANESRKFVSGFEEGRIYNGYRYVHPISWEGRHVGTVETSFSTSAIVRYMDRLYPSRRYVFAMRKAVVQEKVFDELQDAYHECDLTDQFVIEHNQWVENSSLVQTFSPEEQPVILNKLIQALARLEEASDPGVAIVEQGGQHFFLGYKPVENIEGNEVAALFTLSSAKEVDAITQDYQHLRLYAWMGNAVFGILLGLSFFLWRTRAAHDREAYRKVDRLTQHLPGMVYQYQFDFESGHSWFPYSNRGIKDIYGVEPSEVSQDATPVFNVIHPEDRERITESIRESAAQLTMWHDEYRVCFGDSREEYWREGYATPERLEDGSVLWHGFIADTTNRKSREQQLNALRERFEAMFMGSDCVQFMINPEDGSFVNVNPAACQYYGYSEEAFRKLKIFDINELSKDKIFEEMKAARQMNRSYFQFRHRLANGEVRDVDVHSNTVVIDGKKYLYSIVHDITDRKQAELKLKESETRFNVAIEGTEAGIWDWDMVNNTVTFSEQWKSMLGYKDAEIENSFEAWKNLWHPDDGAAIEKAIADHLNGNTQKYEIVHRCRHKDGSWRWLMARGKILRDAAGKPDRWIGTHVDITPQKQAEEDERIAREQAEQANRSKSAFLATMSHEIRTPMNAVIGMSSLLLNSELSSKQREYAETIRSSGDALLTLINDILDFSKIESEKITLEEIPFDLSDCIVEPLDILATKARERNIQLAYEIEASAPCTLVGDVARIKQILLNLLSNAVKFSEDGSDVALSVNCRKLPDERYELTCAIQDEGIGISEEAGKQLFKPFTQANSSITRRYGGTGLGLVISKRLAELMDGNLSFKSREGAGTTFFLKLPLRSGAIRKKIFDRPDAHSLKGKKLLVVDDNAVNLRLFKTETEAWGMTTSSAQSVTEALEKVSQFKPDIILTDYQMPDLSGKDLAERIRSITPNGHIPIVLCSSQSISKADVPESLFASILLKPVRQSALYDALICAGGSDPKQAHSKTTIRKNEIDDTLASYHPLNILVTEDNLINQRVITSILGKMGYLADTAGDGQEAIDALKRQAYDLILMDIEMPRMTGFDATKQIRSTFPASQQPTIAALTANAVGEQQTACLQLGMDAYLTKPVRIQELTELIKGTSSKRQNPTDSVKPTKQSFHSDTQSNIEPLLDIESIEMLAEVSSGDYPLEEFLSGFGTILEKDFNAMKEIIKSGEFAQMRKLLHRIYGGVSSLGMKAMSEQIQNIRVKLKATNTMPTTKNIQALEALATKTLEAYKEANYVRKDFQW